MKIINVCIVLSFLFLTTGFAQSPIIDSLKNELSIHPEKDSTRVNILNKLAFAYFRKDLAKTVECLEESKAIADSIGFVKGKAKSLYIRGMAQAVSTKYDKGLVYFEEALQWYKDIDYKQGIDKCYSSMGIYFYKRGEQKLAITYYLKSVQLKEEVGVKKDMAKNLRFIGLGYLELGEYDEALTYYDKALGISKEENDQKSMAESYNSIGNIYSSLGNYPLALEYLNKALFIREQNEDNLGVSRSLNNIGIVYKQLGNYDKAIEYYEKALPISKEVGYKRTTSSILNNLGTLYMNKNNYDKALEHLMEALKLNEAINNKANMAISLNNIGGLHLELDKNSIARQYFERAEKINLETENQRGLCNSYFGIARGYFNQEMYDQALNSVLKSKQIADELQMLTYQRDVAGLLSKIYDKTGKHQNAFLNHQQFKVYNDSIFNKENIEKITQLEYEYKYKQALDSASIRESMLAGMVESTSQDLEKSQRNIFLTIIAFLIVALVLGGFIFYLKLRNEKTKNQKILIEQKLLRSQMTPHFIFNSLSVLQGLILNKEKKNAVFYLSKFSKLLRTILENSRHQIVPLAEELSAINSYIALQNQAVDPPFQYTLTVDSEIDKSALSIPPMLIQPFVENIIEHAFPDKREDKMINIELKREGGKLVCTIADNGVGFDAAEEKTLKDKNSLATSITSERLELLSKEFNTPGSLSVKNRKSFGEQGTLITLVIPYKI